MNWKKIRERLPISIDALFCISYERRAVVENRFLDASIPDVHEYPGQYHDDVVERLDER